MDNTIIEVPDTNTSMVERVYEDIQAGSFSVVLVATLLVFVGRKSLTNWIEKIVESQTKIADTLKELQHEIRELRDQINNE